MCGCGCGGWGWGGTQLAAHTPRRPNHPLRNLPFHPPCTSRITTPVAGDWVQQRLHTVPAQMPNRAASTASMAMTDKPPAHPTPSYSHRDSHSQPHRLPTLNTPAYNAPTPITSPPPTPYPPTPLPLLSRVPTPTTPPPLSHHTHTHPPSQSPPLSPPPSTPNSTGPSSPKAPGVAVPEPVGQHDPEPVQAVGQQVHSLA